ncbi:DHBP synthase RibB-like alpha/beta domain-containing protein [Actinidia rufa]|uniref:Threonylcarbamoyl-AMP synthase n=1 Tax=Actinidia rufa TaxID=165716 RepID=A0A7J0H7R5_9ERIC|nr:DHBP synthase RibB-like alpha/beta domain-containing protein [Actinidia rufa]
MALEAKVYGSATDMALSCRRSLHPFPSRVFFQSIEPRRVRFLPMAVVKRNPKRLKYAAPRFTKEDGLLYVEVDPSGADSWKLDPIIKLLKEGAVGYTFILTASKELPKRCTRYGTTTPKCVVRKNVGVRIPDDAVCRAILEKMDAPLISTSVKSLKENEWIIDPVVIADVYGPEGLDFVVDAGLRVADPSTVVDMTGSFPRIIRQGKGPKQPWMVEEDDKILE